MAIKVENGEHNFRKPACAEYCYIDPEFCPLFKKPLGESGNTKPLKLSIRRWSDYQENTVYDIDYANKLSPRDQLPKLTTSTDKIPQKPDLPSGTESIPDYDEKIKHEHESFTPFSCWGDGSGFERDIMPGNLVGPGGTMESLYDLSYYPINTAPLQLSDWNTWVDKFQTDYRFVQVSDLNAETILFPNVDDPWMFTEYIFKGTGSGEVIVEPPLYDEETLQLKNADKVLDTDNPEILNKYSESVSKPILEHEATEDSDPVYRNARFVKSYRQVCHWDELNTAEDRRTLSRFSSLDNGGKLYRVDIPVQSVKWGEHGNIPPNTLNMGAPAEWMDVSKTAAKIRPTYVAHIGIPYYANSYGVVYWKDNDAYIAPLAQDGLTKVEDPTTKKPFYQYEITSYSEDDTPDGVKQNTPRNVVAQSGTAQNGARLANTYLPSGTLSHGGCQLLKSEVASDGTGRCYCKSIETMRPDDPLLGEIKENFEWSRCSTNNENCPNFVSGPEYPILADFQATAYNRAQYNEQVLGIYSGSDADSRLWADNLLQNSTGLPTADMFVAMGLGTTGRMGREDIYNPTEVSVWYEAQFEVVYESENPVQLSKQVSSGNGFGRGVEVLRGTGKMALNTYENSNAFRGDTVFFGDMDQRGFSRWFETPMFCAKAAYCNDICGVSMQSGWDASERAGSSEGGCRYYRSANTKGATNHIGCPTTCVQKRAFEFQNTMTTCSPAIISLAEMWKALTDKERNLYNSNTENTYYFDRKSNVDGFEVWDVWSRSDSVVTAMGGVMVKETRNSPEELYLFCRIQLSEPVQGYFWYQSMDNAGVAKDVWFCKCDTQFVEFTRNTLIITNEEKFIGGYHPQYKDYSKMGPEYLQDVESDSYRDAMGDIIGDVDYDGQPQATNKKGYWTDASGDYIVDEISTGTETPIATDESRKNAGSPTTISLKKGNTSVDVETGKMTRPKTVNCAVHSNDPFWLMEEFRKSSIDPETGKRVGRPMLEDDNGGEPYWAPPNIQNRWALPTMRMAAHCPKCDYYISWRYHDMLCPWCGTRLERIAGDKGEGMDVGSRWPESASILKKFFKLNAIGKVQVWAPPGTCVPLDGYYWKNPTVVTNTIIRQIKYRLGTFKNNSWQGDGMSADREFSLGYSEQMGYFIPIPDFKSEELDSQEVYGYIEWKGVSKEDRSRYASYNDIMPYNPLPGFVTDSMNEAIIVPYTDASDDGLKMITVSEIIALRNRIEPVIAYSSDLPYQGDFPRSRASYEKREEDGIPRYISKAHCRVPSVILAANDSGIDSHVQFWSGDYEWGTVREYYPPGMSWWWLNQLIGGKYSDLTGGNYHMDGTEADGSPYRHSGGNRTVSKCAMFIHGMLPLDKEILAAYAILSPAGEPSKDPIGRGWNGVIHYNHYHAMTEEHKGDGREPHLHGQAGFDTGFDENGDYIYSKEKQIPASEVPFPIVPMDESDYYGWATESNRPTAYRSLYKSNFLSDWTGLPGVRDEGFWKQYGTSKTNVNSSNDPIYSYDGDLSSGLVFNGRKISSAHNAIRFKLIGQDDEGNLRQNYDTDKIWQTMTQKEMQEEIDKSLVDVEFSVSDGNRQNDITYDFQQFADKFISSTLPEQMQSIPGYFDFAGINSEKRLPNVVNMQNKEGSTSFDKPIIIQAEGEPPTSYTGDSGTDQAGIINRVFDITSIFKAHYNSRIERRYYCQAGKSLSEVSQIEFAPPRWEGVGNWENQEQAEKWNSQQRGSGFTGYLLNDDYSFPKLESDRTIPEPANDGTQYQLETVGIQILSTFLLPFTIKEGNNRFWISKNGEETEIQSLPTGNRITTVQQVVELLYTMFGEGYEVSIVSSSSCLISKISSESNDSLEIKECQGSCYGYFSLPTGSISGIQDRVVSVTSFATGFHPASLLNGKSWITNGYIFDTQKAVFDLCRAPLEESERDYRYQAPSINCASCICPNEDCLTNGQTAGIYAERKGLTFGDGQTACPACGTDLSGQPGAVILNGDGLYSWYYQESFQENPFITGFEIAAAEKTSFRVSCRNAESSTWTSLLNVIYDESSQNYTYYFNGRSYTTRNIPESFALTEPNWRRSRYIQIEVDPAEGESQLVFEDLEVENNYSVKAAGNFQEMGLFDWSDLECEVTYRDPENSALSTEKKVLSTVTLNDTKTELTFYFKSSFEVLSVTKLVLNPKRYTSEIKKFKVYGFHYKKSELTMTGSALEKYFFFSTKKSSYQLEEFPTQLLAVSIGKNDSGGIILKEAENRESLNYELGVRKFSTVNAQGAMEEKEVYTIKSGNYYFDPVHNRIYLPEEGSFGSQKIKLEDFESALKGIKENVTFYPTRVSVRYWTGSGEPVTLEAMAENQGPSYQVEKDTITTIENINALPDNGISAKMPDMNGNIAKRAIPWVCYNHIPATLAYGTQTITGGYFQVPNLKSTTLGTTVDNDKFFVDQFGENLTRIVGRCRTEVTFYGAPEQVLSGTIWVKAPAYTTKVIDTGAGAITVRERTGGLKHGCFIFKMPIKPCKGRKSLCWSKPVIIVYAKERNPSDPL